jgi:hypothetical protein
MTEIRIGQIENEKEQLVDLCIPEDVQTITTAVLGIRNTGKSHTASVIVEGLLDLRRQVVVIDPTDVWWGMKSSKDGKSEGHKIVVLGGAHADLPLVETDGAIIADFVIEHNISVILSLRHLRKAAQRRFVTAFTEQLYYRKGEVANRTPVLIAIDECDTFVPQKVGGGEAQMVGAIEDLVRRGRAAGIGVMLISQRAASINKDVLTQIELLVAHRHTSPQDRKALLEWVKAHDTGDKQDQFLLSLASLERGEAWFWSPAWLDLFKLVKVRERHTFDSSGTPKAGQSLSPTKTAEIDLDALKEKLTHTIEEKKANDPKELKRRIAELERQLDHETQHFDAKETQEYRNLLAHCEALEAADGRFEDENKKLREQNDWFREHLAHIEKKAEEVIHACDRAGEVEAIPSSAEYKIAPTLPPKTYDYSSGAEVVTTAKLNVSNNGHAKITKPQQRILQALRSMEPVGFNAVSKPFTAVLAGASPASGAYANNLSALRTAGLLDYPRAGYLALTDHGRDQTEPVDLPWLRTIPRSLIENLTETQAKILMEVVASKPHSAPTLSEYQTAWLGKVSNPQRRILEHLISIYPQSVDKESLAASAEASATSGAYANNLSYLRSSCGLIDYPQQGYVVATELLFPDGLR